MLIFGSHLSASAGIQLRGYETLCIMVVFIILILILAVQLLRYRREWNRLASLLEETGPESNLSLGTGVYSRPFLRFLDAVNKRLESGRNTQQKMKAAQDNLKYTISCVSHDIRTPLTGASGYLQLLEHCEEESKRARYTAIISSKLGELEGMLNELFMYTKVGNEEYPVNLQSVNVQDAVCRVVAGFYEQFEAAGRECVLSFENEAMDIWADQDSLKRIFLNLTENSLKHGIENLYIRQQGLSLIFENRVSTVPDTSKLFDRFYKADSSRNEAGTGLGLAIVKLLMDKMNGKVQATLTDDLLSIELRWPPVPGGRES